MSSSHVLHMEHFKLQHPTLKPYTCTASGCTKTFGTRDRLKRHMVTHDLTRRPFTCPQCHRELSNESSVLSHIRLLHTAPKQTFTCLFEGCKYVTTLAKYLAVHEKTHSSSRQEFKCDHPGCDLTFYYKKSLKSHFKVHAPDVENKVKDEVKNKVKIKVKDEVEDEVKDEVKDDVKGLKCLFCTDLEFTCNFCKAFSSKHDQDYQDGLIELPLIELPFC